MQRRLIYAQIRKSDLIPFEEKGTEAITKKNMGRSSKEACAKQPRDREFDLH